MAKAQVWFSSTSNSKMNSHFNIFDGDPVWNITSWHKHRTSTPQPMMIELGALEFKDENSSHKKSGSDDSSSTFPNVEVVFNMKMLIGSSTASQRDVVNGVDKFKLLGIVTC